MNTMALNGSLGAPPLITLLTEWVGADITIPHAQFCERLGRFIDFSGSIILSEAHGKRRNKPESKSLPGERTVTEAFLRARGKLIRHILENCLPIRDQGEEALPDTHVAAVTERSADYEAYRVFYKAQQGHLRIRIQSLQAEVRAQATAMSAEMAKLAVLDEALSDALLTRARLLTSMLPTLLEKRFYHLKQASADEAEQVEGHQLPEGGFLQISQEIKMLLLAEMDFRLQPVLGLVEAIHTGQEGTADQ